jgi:hypothetical protein
MKPDKLWTPRCERLSPFDQIEWLPGIGVFWRERQQQRSRGQIAGSCSCNEDSNFPVACGTQGLAVRSASSHVRTPRERQRAK